MDLPPARIRRLVQGGRSTSGPSAYKPCTGPDSATRQPNTALGFTVAQQDTLKLRFCPNLWMVKLPDAQLIAQQSPGKKLTPTNSQTLDSKMSSWGPPLSIVTIYQVQPRDMTRIQQHPSLCLLLDSHGTQGSMGLLNSPLCNK